MKNTILLERLTKLLITRGTGKLDKSLVATFNQNLQVLGYTLSPEALEAVSTLSVKECTKLNKAVVQTLKDLRGVKQYRPMYPNFPEQVMNASDAELYLNAFAHYFTAWVSDVTGADCIWLPKYTKKQREPLQDKIELTVIRLAQEDDLRTLATAIATSNTSISESDKLNLTWLIINKYLDTPDHIPHKENAAIVGALLIDQHDVSHLFKTATDVLRLAVAMSGGDVSLATPTKFGKFGRRTRRTLLAMLDGLGQSRTEDMNRWKMRWIRLGERLHPGEFQNRYPGAFASFMALRTNATIETFNSKAERFVRKGDVKNAVPLLSQRPGDFARRLDHLLRVTPSKNYDSVLDGFEAVANEVSTPVLLQVAAHFRHRSGQDFRVVFPKGNVAKVKVLPNDLLVFPTNVCAATVGICNYALSTRFAALPSLGKVYVNLDLSEYLVPFSQRSASKSLRSLVRGSRIKFSTDANTIRFFIWWKDGESRTDIDLSAVMYDADWTFMENIAYTNLRSSQDKAFHSGDITSAPKGACEFIDIDIPSHMKHGGRYVVMVVNSFTGQPLSDVPECTAGWMMRQQPQSGEVFDARTVVDKLDLTTAAKGAMPMVIDLVDRKIIWADAALKVERGYSVQSNMLTQISLLGRAFTQINKPTLYNLLMLHAVSRGTELVYDKAQADTVFSAETTPYELERITSEFMQTPVKVAKALV
jgi:stress response protein SCP2